MLNNLRTKIYNFLRWSEKYTKTDMVYLTKGGFWLVLGQIITVASAFLLAIAFANLLPKETYGTYKYILSVAGLLGIFTLTGMNTAVTQAVAKGYEGVLKKSFWVQIQWGIILFLVALLGAIYYFSKGNQILAISLLIIGSFSPLLNSANTYTAFLGGKKFFKVLSQYNIISAIVCSALLFSTILVTKKPLPLILVYFISNTAVNLFFYIKTLKTFKPNQEMDSGSLSFGKHLSLIYAVSTAATYIDNPLLFHFFGSADVAIYALAIAAPEQIKALLKNISSLALPKFSEGDLEETKKAIRRKVFIFTLAIAAVVVTYIILAPLLFKIFFPKYLDSVFYSQIYAISIIASSLYLPYTLLQSQVAKKALYSYNIWTAVIQIVLMVISIYFWGILGAVLSRTITRFISLAYSLWLTKRI